MTNPNFNFNRFCDKCGTELREISVDTKKYNPKTGKKIYHHKLVCPNKKWYNFHADRLMAVYTIGTEETYIFQFED